MPTYRKPADEPDVPAPVKAWLADFVREARKDKLSFEAFQARLSAVLERAYRVVMAEEAEHLRKAQSRS